jgi:hypothetical protein
MSVERRSVFDTALRQIGKDLAGYLGNFISTHWVTLDVCTLNFSDRLHSWLRAALFFCLTGGVAIGQMPTRLLYQRLGPVKTGVFIADGDGGHERALVRPDSLDYNASFSTDGKWIVFSSERSGTADIGSIPTAMGSNA